LRRIALVTHAGLPELTADDRLLLPELKARGGAGQAVVWSDPSVKWEEFDAIVLRSCWDYHLRCDEVLHWLDRLRRSVWNPPALVHWNADKRYLRALQRRGVPLVPTLWIEPGQRVEAPWERAVVKPVVSASAYRTRLVSAGGETTLADVPLMLQPFLKQVVEEGEWSLLFFGGAFSHAVIKRPRGGDFRVQNEYGGSS
jgi:hypothetical protein